MVIVRTDLDRAKSFYKKGALTKYANKEQQVLFRVTIDDFNFDEAIECYKKDVNIVMLEYEGTDEYLKATTMDKCKGVYMTKSIDVGTDVTSDDIDKIVSTYPSFLTLIIKLPQEFNDMKFIKDMCNKYSNIRFCGGTLFQLDGVRLGCCGADKLGRYKVKDREFIKVGCGCALPVLSDKVELIKTDTVINVKPIVNRGSTVKSVRSSKSDSNKKVSKAQKFSEMLGSNDGFTF